MANDSLRVSPCQALHGDITLPGDKSISHRAVLFAALANGVSRIRGFLASEDCLATIKACQQLGVKVERLSETELMVHGVGLRGFQAPTQPIDCQNSGTSMRLLAGILAGQSFSSELIGDASLSKRPMQRIIQPLTQMGAQIESNHGKPPLVIQANTNLQAIDYTMPMASAQVKTCLLLAGLLASGTTIIRQPQLSRDHTERLLPQFGVQLSQQDLTLQMAGQQSLTASDICVPGDISHAAFFMVAASIVPGSDLTLRNVGINPTRDGVVRILQSMGANIEILQTATISGEPVADLRVKHAPLQAVDVPEQLVPLAIDEFPILFVAAACADGTSRMQGLAELRVKESDRLAVMADALTQLGITVHISGDVVTIVGGQMQGGCEFSSHGDHRIAMALAIAGLHSEHGLTVLQSAAVASSFPNFVQLAKLCGMAVET